MMIWFEEFLYIVAYSKRTQLAIWLGLISFVVILVVGEYFVGRIAFDGPLAPMTEMVQKALYERYDKAAWASLGSFLLLAIKFYRKDKKKLLAY